MDQIVPEAELRVRRRAAPPPVEESEGSEGQGFKFSFGDICYVLYRHKWKIAFFSIAGLAAAAVMYYLAPHVYRSEARLIVKYVAERETLGPVESDSIRSGVYRGEQVVNSELVILSSMDLARSVAEVVGPGKILAPWKAGSNVVVAARIINKGTKVSAPFDANAIQVTFEHPDSQVVQPVLSELIRQYMNKHYDVHQALSSLEEFKDQKQKLEEELRTVSAELLNFRKTNQVFALEQAKTAAAEQVSKAHQVLSEAELDLAQKLTAIKMLEEGKTNIVSNRSPEELAQSRQRYNELTAQLEQARRMANDLSVQYSAASGMVKPWRDKSDQLMKQRKQLEEEDPMLALSVASSTGGSQAFDPLAEKLRIRLLENKVDVLRNELEKARREEARLYEIEAPIARLERQKALLEKKFNYFAEALDKTHIDASLGATRSDNIREVQSPSPPYKVVEPLFKRMAMAVGSGVMLGIALAFFLELFVDQSVKRSAELSRLLPVPVYLSIPKSVGRSRRLSARKQRALIVNGEPGRSRDPDSRLERKLQPYFEALRDRIINRFTTLARKPKLVAVCDCHDGSASATTAAGLAAALSEAGDLKVLLVDMNSGDRGRNPGVANRRSCSLIEALEENKRAEALIAPNLYLATAGGAEDHGAATSPSRFTRVVPQLNASDYDYIVFDLPAVDQVSITPGLAKHMDLTLLVVEAERTSRKAVKDAGALLLEFTPNVALMLNDTQETLPRWLRQAV